MCAVRPHRVLRQLAVTARLGARTRERAPGHPELRAGRGLVLELRGGGLRQWTDAGTAARTSERPARAATCRSLSQRLAAAPSLAIRVVSECRQDPDVSSPGAALRQADRHPETIRRP